MPVRPREDVPGSGVKVRDNWLVPWAYGDAYGYLFVRGIARPLTNFGDAVALLAQALWPRLPGVKPQTAGAVAPAPSPLPALIEQAQQISERLVATLREERERVGTPGDQATTRLAELEAQLASAHKARAEAEAERERVRADMAGLK